MKKKMNLVLAAACLLASGLYLSGCQKDIRKPEQAQVETKTATPEKSFTARSSARDASDGEYSLTPATVELTDEGRENLLASRRSEMKQTGELSFLTIKGGGTYDPGPQPDPIICDGKTYFQLWADIDQKLAAFINSPAGQALQARANATCRPQFYGVCNCFICMLCVMEPNRPCYRFDEVLEATQLDISLVREQ